MDNVGVAKDDIVSYKAKSYATMTQNEAAAKKDTTKRKIFSPSGAVMSLDQALVRLKNSKLGSDSGIASASASPLRCSQAAQDLFREKTIGSAIFEGLGGASVLSMNFSDYELMRNLSRSNSIDGVYSGSPDAGFSQAVADEQIERYFRSVEMWHKFRDTESLQFQVPEH